MKIAQNSMRRGHINNLTGTVVTVPRSGEMNSTQNLRLESIVHKCIGIISTTILCLLVVKSVAATSPMSRVVIRRSAACQLRPSREKKVMCLRKTFWASPTKSFLLQ